MNVYLPEPCTINEHVLNNNNILLKWRLEGELIFLHGDIIEFLCKQGYELSQSTGTSQLTTHCNRGKINYPTCIMEGKIIAVFWLLACLFLTY